MKKILAILLVALFLLSACANGGGSSGSGASGGTKEIRFMSMETPGNPNHEIMMAMIEQFMADNPDVIVEADLMPSAELRTKITVEMAAGNPPEIGSIIPSYAWEFMRGDLIEDWRPIMANHPEFEQMIPLSVILDMEYEDGRIMSMPFEASMDALYINKEIFDANGWALPETFDDLLDLCAKARQAGIHLMVTGGRDIRFAWLATVMLSRTGGYEAIGRLTRGDAQDQWSNPEFGFPSMLEHFAQLVAAEIYPPDVLAFSGLDADQFFARGEAAMYYEGAWKPQNFVTAGGTEFTDKLIRIDYPAFPNGYPGGDPDVRVGGSTWGLMIPVGHSPEIFDACIRFAKAHLNPEVNAKMMETGGRIFAGAANTTWDSTKTMPIFNQCVEAFETATRTVLPLDALVAPAIDLAIKQTVMPGIVAGEMTVQQAVDFVQMTAEEHLRAIGG